MMATAIRILYVDDEESLLEIGKIFLEESGDLSVATSESAPAALERLKNEQFDAIVSDYQMPDMDGIQFLAEVRARFGLIPFILFTGKGREEVVIQAINSGADFYLQKGGEPQSQFAELEHKIKQAVSRKMAEDSLRRSEEKYRQLIQNSDEAIVIVQDGILRMINHRAVELSGYPQEELLSLSFLEFIHPDDRAMVAERYQKRLRGEGFPMRYPFRLNPKDGSTKWVEIGAIMIDWDERPATLNFLTDITERKVAEDALHSRNRALQLISSADSLMMHTTDEQTLLDEICAMIISTGGYRMVWIGFALQDATKTVRPVAQSGFEDGYLETINITWTDEIRGRGPTGTAIRTGRYCIARNIRTDPAFGPWRDAAIRHGYQSSIALPLENDGAIFGALNIYSWEPDKFDDDEIALLSQLARDLSFGIHTLRARILRRKAEEALVESEAKYRLIVENSRDIIYILSTTGMFLYVSPSVTQVLGYQPEDLIGQPFASIIHPDDITSLQKRFARTMLEDYETEGIEYRARHFSGEWRWHISRGHAVRDAAGNVLNFTGIANDITERKTTDDELRLTQTRLESALETGNIAWWEMDCITGNVFFNERKARMLGYPAEQFTHYTHFTQLLHPDDYEPTMQAMRDYLSGIIKQYDVDYRIKTHNGEYLWFHDIGGISDYTPDGRPLKITGFVINITKRKLAEEALLQEKNFSDRLFDAPQDTVFLFEPATGKPVRWNKRFADESGYSDDEIAGMKAPDDFYREEDLNKAKEAMARLSVGNIIIELSVVTKQGTLIPFEYSATVVSMADGRSFLLSIGRNITERKRMEDAMQESGQRIIFSLESADIGAWDLDLVTHTAWRSLRHDQIFGYEELLPEWTYEMFLDHVLLEDRSIVDTKFGKALENFQEWDFECRIRRKDGAVRQIWAKGRPEYNDLHQPVKMFGIVQDITERKQADETLQKNEIRYRTLVDSMHDCIAVYRAVEDGKDFEFIDFNKAAERTENMSRNEVIGRRVTEVFPGVVEFGLLDVLRRVWHTGTAESFPLSFYKDNRVSGWRNNFVYKLATGEIVAGYRDETAKKLAEDALVESESFNRGLVENLPDYIVVYGPDGRILYANPASAKVMGCNTDELVGTPLLSYVAVEYRNEVVSKIAKYSQDGEISPYEIDIVTHSGLRSIIVKGTPIRYHESHATLLVLTDITDRKRAEVAIQESEEKYRLLFSTITEGVVLIATDGQIVDANPAAEHILGLTRSEIGGRQYDSPDWEIIHPDGTPMLPEEMAGPRAMLEKRSVKDVVMGIRRPDGFISWINVNAATILDNAGNLNGVVGTFNDITDRKRAEKALLESEARLHLSVQSANIGLWDWDIKRDTVYYSPEWKSHIGYRDDELPNIFDEWQRRLHPDDLESTLQTLNTYLANPEGRYEDEFRLKHKDGSYRWINSHANVLRNADGKPVRMLGVHIEITRRKQAEEELMFKNALLSTQQETLPGAILIVNETGKILNYNQNFIEMWGIPEDVIASRSDERALQSVIEKLADKEGFLARINYLNVHIYDKSYEEIRLTDGRVLDRYSAPMFGEKQRYFGRVWYFRDITALKKSETDLLSSLHDKELLLKEIHHRVKNNLQTIASLLYLQSLSTDDEAIKKLLNEARSRVYAMGLIHQKLYQSADITRIPFTDYISQLIEYLKESYGVDETKIRISVSVKPEDLFFDLDTGIPCGLIINELVMNALKYAFCNRPGGTITIHMSRDETGQNVLLVSDDGHGISEDFDLTTMKSLGMTIVASLVRQLGGTMEMVRQPGTTITIRFPTQAPLPYQQPASHEKPVADDEPGIDEKIKRIRARHD